MGQKLKNLPSNIGPSCYSKEDIVKVRFSMCSPIWHYWQFSHFFIIFHRQFVNSFENCMEKLILLKLPVVKTFLCRFSSKKLQLFYLIAFTLIAQIDFIIVILKMMLLKSYIKSKSNRSSSKVNILNLMIM